jgi:hypothetical protein
MEYEEKSWKNLDRMYNFFQAKARMRMRMKVPKTLVDLEGIDIIHEERRQLEENPEGPNHRLRLKPERSAGMRPRARVFFWG